MRTNYNQMEVTNLSHRVKPVMNAQLEMWQLMKDDSNKLKICDVLVPISR